MRIAILAHDKFAPTDAKTAACLLRYRRDEVVAVVDRSKAGTDAGAVIPWATGVPVVASVKDAAALRPDALFIGIAPVGGALPADWRAELLDALRAGMDVVSGLHTFLNDDPALAEAARRVGRRIVDVRRPPVERRITTGEGALVDSLVVLTVGTDCSSGKMTATVELAREARRRGLDAAFVATGQTGIMVGCDEGAPVDAIVGDFMAGEVERMVLACAARGKSPIFVEGQGCITHPAYSGVTAALLHGAFPDLLVLCDEPARDTLRFPCARPFRTNPLPFEVRANEMLLEPTTGGKVAALALMTRGLSDAQAAQELRKAEAETGIPAADVYREGGVARILDGVLDMAAKRGLL
ncbi:MAG TPA: DUF1611 domain-containing protein [Candidatus Thermoplasmatota archaeon]|nr:DUF1611 domain-containing protein [Candidatus Thermoplasmatota archaeon]